MFNMSLEELEPLVFRSFRGRQDVAPSEQRLKACWPILIAEALERLAWYSLIVNLIILLGKPPLCFESYTAATAQLTATSVSYGVGLLAGWASDSYFGDYPTIIAGYVIYVLGYTLLLVVVYYMPVYNVWTFEEDLCTRDRFFNATATLPDSGGFCSVTAIDDNSCATTIYSALIVIAFGAGIVRTNMAPFGGDQVSADIIHILS